MRLLTTLALTLAAVTAQAAEPASAITPPRTALVIHGGAGFVPKDSLSAADLKDVHATLNQALDAGNKVLRAGGSALDAVELMNVGVNYLRRFLHRRHPASLPYPASGLRLLSHFDPP